MRRRYKYLFGPVASRRLGLSLGVDIVPLKTCTYDCVYCECGATTQKVLERKSWMEPKEVLAEIKDFLRRNNAADFITFTGSGEPTLNKDFGWLIRETKKLTQIPLAVLTNGSLLWDEQVREELMAANVVLPSLDAVSEKVFNWINRPSPQLGINKIIAGIARFRQEFTGEVWLEILFCKGINDSEEEIKNLVKAVELIRPHKIQLGTVVRPPAIAGIEEVDDNFLARVVQQLGEPAEIIGHPRVKQKRPEPVVADEELLNLLRRRPTTAEELSRAFDVPLTELSKQLHQLELHGKIEAYKYGSEIFFKARAQ